MLLENKLYRINFVVSYMMILIIGKNRVNSIK